MSEPNLTSGYQQRQNLGRSGEQQAAAWLQQHGYIIRDTNWRAGQEEIDIVALDTATDEIVFVEVKTRQSNFSGDPSDQVDARKLQAQVRAGYCYCRQKELENDFRFDIVSVLPDEITHYENITWP